jgi:hypothetical protein
VIGIILSGIGLQHRDIRGGTLMGVKTDDIAVLERGKGDFFTSMKIAARQDNFKWEVVNVYGLVQIERKSEFLLELSQKI